MFVPEKITVWQRLLSYLLPVNIASFESNENPHLELLLYKNQFQLATEDALYSDGKRYLPFKKSFKQLPKGFWCRCQRVLVLGAGLGSAVQILRHSYAPGAYCTLVDHDREILILAAKLLSADQPGSLELVPADAFDYVENCRNQHNLVCIDIFKNRIAPDNCTQMPFLTATQKLVAPGGYWIMNYIIHDPLRYYQLRKNLDQLFEEISLIKFHQNIVLIAKTSKEDRSYSEA